MLTYFVATFLFIGLALSGSTPRSNQYVDTTFYNNLPNDILRNRMDPYFLPDFSQSYKDKVAFVSVNVKTDYKRGNLTGMSRPIRARECSPVNFLRGEYRLNCSMAFTNLTVAYQGTTKFGVVPSINFNVKAPINRVVADFELSSAAAGGRNPRVTNFILTSGIFFNPQFSGLGAASSIEKSLKANFTMAVTGHISNALYYQFRTAFERSVKNTTLPL